MIINLKNQDQLIKEKIKNKERAIFKNITKTKMKK